MQTFENLFPFNIISFSRIAHFGNHVYEKKCDCYSAIWKIFILFSQKISQPYLIPKVWIKMLNDMRSKIVANNPQPAEIRLKIKKAVCEISFKKVHPLNTNELDILINSSSYFITPKTPDDVLISICHLICRLYDQFKKESVEPDGSPKSILLSYSDIQTDMILCVKNIISQYQLIFQGEISWLMSELFNQFKFISQRSNLVSEELIKSIEATEKEKVSVLILRLYTKFFEPITEEAEVPLVYTTIFTHYSDFNVFHYIFSQMFTNAKERVKADPQLASVPFMESMPPLLKKIIPLLPTPNKESREIQMSELSDFVTNIIDLIQENDEVKYRKIVAHSLKEIKDVIEKNKNQIELIPINIYKQAVE